MTPHIESFRGDPNNDEVAKTLDGQPPAGWEVSNQDTATKPSGYRVEWANSVSEPSFNGVESWDAFAPYVEKNISDNEVKTRLLALDADRKYLEATCEERGIGTGYIGLAKPMAWRVMGLAPDQSIAVALERYNGALKLLLEAPFLQQLVAQKKLEFGFGGGVVSSGYAVIKLEDTPQQTWESWRELAQLETKEARERQELSAKEKAYLEDIAAAHVKYLGLRQVTVDLGMLGGFGDDPEMLRRIVGFLNNVINMSGYEQVLGGKRIVLSKIGPPFVVLEGGVVQVNITEPILPLVSVLHGWVQKQTEPQQPNL